MNRFYFIRHNISFYINELSTLSNEVSIPASSRTLQAAKQLREEIKKTPANDVYTPLTRVLILIAIRLISTNFYAFICFANFLLTFLIFQGFQLSINHLYQTFHFGTTLFSFLFFGHLVNLQFWYKICNFGKIILLVL